MTDRTAAERMRRRRARLIQAGRVERKIYVFEATWNDIRAYAEARGAICPEPRQKKARAATRE